MSDITLAEIDDDTAYAVKLKRPVIRGSRTYLPRNQLQFKGRVIREIAANPNYGWEVFDAVHPA